MFKLRTVVAFGLMAMFVAGEASAQMFPNAFWNRGKQVQSVQSNCPGGICPTSYSAVDTRPGHWSYPGTIDSHLESTHGVATAGLTRQQKLNLHDALHEGTAPNLISSAPRVNYVPYVSNYPSVSQVTGGGSTGSLGGGSSGGSSGGFGIGTRLPDGAIVTSVGVTVASSTQATAEVSQLRIGDRISFRKSLLAAARNARDAGEITSLEFFLLSASSRNPAVLERMQAAVHEAAIEEGLATTQAIDWDQLIQFIEKLIPIIIKLIELFGQAQMEATPMYASSYVLAPIYSLAA